MRFDMPVKSSDTSVIKWPDRATVERALSQWVAEQADRHPELQRLGYFGSYARDDWGVGSDLDLVAVVNASDVPFERRPVDWKTETLPVPAEILIYTQQEWSDLQGRETKFAEMLNTETVWIFPFRKDP